MKYLLFITILIFLFINFNKQQDYKFLQHYCNENRNYEVYIPMSDYEKTLMNKKASPKELEISKNQYIEDLLTRGVNQ